MLVSVVEGVSSMANTERVAWGFFSFSFCMQSLRLFLRRRLRPVTLDLDVRLIISAASAGTEALSTRSGPIERVCEMSGWFTRIQVIHHR